MSWFSSLIGGVEKAVTSVENDVKDVVDDVGEAAEAVAHGFEDAGAAADTFVLDVVAAPIGLGLYIANAIEGNDDGSSVKMGDPTLTQQELQNGFSYQADPNSELFEAGGPNIDDIHQGQVGDCYFLSSLGAVAAKDPQQIQNMVRDNGDGTYSVRFYYNNGLGLQPEWVTVDGTLPENQGGDLGASTPTDAANGKQVLWVAIIEKAYADFNSLHHTGGSGDNSYDGTSDGMASNAYQCITGNTAEDVPVWFMSDGQLFNALSQANGGQTIMASTDSSEDPNSNIVASHCYAVLGTSTVDGVQYVTLRNPWGSSGIDDSTFQIPLSQFRQDYSTVTLPDSSRDMLAADIRQIIVDV